MCHLLLYSREKQEITAVANMWPIATPAVETQSHFVFFFHRPQCKEFGKKVDHLLHLHKI